MSYEKQKRMKKEEGRRNKPDSSDTGLIVS